MTTMQCNSVQFNIQRNIKTTYDKLQSDRILALHNKTPRWNESMQAFCLNFYKRVTQASVKNFQLVDANDDEIFIQFGKVGQDTFTLDFKWPICPLQAFGICLTSLDDKRACQ